MKLQAATLLESVVALSLLASVLSACVLMQSNIMSSRVSVRKYEAYQHSNMVLRYCCSDQSIPPIRGSGVKMDLSISIVRNGLRRVEVKYWSGGTVMYQRTEFIMCDEN